MVGSSVTNFAAGSQMVLHHLLDHGTGAFVEGGSSPNLPSAAHTLPPPK